MASDEYSIEDFPDEKLGEWIAIDADTHFMPVAFISPSGDSAIEVRGIVQVESEQGSIGLCETHVPLTLVMQWLESEDDDE
jgi:hypothetical protein